MDTATNTSSDQSATGGGVPRRTVPLSAAAPPPAPEAPLPVPVEATGTSEIPVPAAPAVAGMADLATPPRPAGLRDRVKRLVDRRRDRAALLDAAITAARVPLVAPVRLVVASPKGGVGKTTVALALAERLAALRADRVAVLDAQPLGGTAGVRIHGQRGLGLPALLAPGVLDEVTADGSYTAWSRWATIEHGSRVTVLGRDEPLEGAELTIDSYGQVVTGLARQWPIVIVDTGAPEGRSVLQAAAVQSADVLVVVCGTGEGTVAATAGWLRDLQIPPERRMGVVVPLGGGDPERATGLLMSHCQRVLQLGEDPALAAEASVPFIARARTSTQDAITQMAGMVMQASVIAREEQQR